MNRASMSEDDDETFRTMVGFFWKEQGDPGRYSGWDPERCKRLMPQFYEAWAMWKLYQGIADTTAEAGR